MPSKSKNIVFISIIFAQIPQLQGFKYYEIIFIYGFSLVPKGLDHLFTDNLWKVAWFIVRKGDFDKYLTRPINPLVHVIMEALQFDALGELLTGIVLMIIASIKLDITYNGVTIPVIRQYIDPKTGYEFRNMDNWRVLYFSKKDIDKVCEGLA